MVTLIGKLPTDVGVPLSLPSKASVSPDGSVLVVEYVTGAEAPMAVKLPLKVVPSVMLVVPLGGVSVIVAQIMASVYCWLPVQLPGPVAVTVKVELPTVVGVPVITPVVLLSISPPGRVPDVTA
jgi:hypothetical protein